MTTGLDFYLFDNINNVISNELNVSLDIYKDVIDEKCTYWEARFIILSLLSEREDKKQKAIKLFKEKL